MAFFLGLNPPIHLENHQYIDRGDTACPRWL